MLDRNERLTLVAMLSNRDKHNIRTSNDTVTVTSRQIIAILVKDYTHSMEHLIEEANKHQE